MAFIGGEVEEEVLRFTRAEQRRHINWRELLGILRVIERWGPDARGLTVVVETDNIVSHFTAEKMTSKASDMQELLRRLLERCESYDITLRTAHTPGKLLYRPDELSRGEKAIAPRQRLRRGWFQSIEKAWGGFDEMLGRESGHPPLRPRDELSCHDNQLSQPDQPVSTVAMWAHPAFASVGHALREVADRLC